MSPLAIHDTAAGHLIFMVLAFLTMCVALALAVMLYRVRKEDRR